MRLPGAWEPRCRSTRGATGCEHGRAHGDTLPDAAWLAQPAAAHADIHARPYAVAQCDAHGVAHVFPNAGADANHAGAETFPDAIPNPGHGLPNAHTAATRAHADGLQDNISPAAHGYDLCLSLLPGRPG
jgi:hypothetical protein